MWHLYGWLGPRLLVLANTEKVTIKKPQNDKNMEHGQVFNSQMGERALWKNESLYNIWKKKYLLWKLWKAAWVLDY